jgi:fructooligosaccharide transport system substrate-binding protein
MPGSAKGEERMRAGQRSPGFFGKLLAVAGAVSLLTAACSGPAAAPAGKPAPAKPTEPAPAAKAAPGQTPAATAAPAAEAKPAAPAAAGKPVTLRFLHVQTPLHETGFGNVIEDFTKVRPDITVEREQVPFLELFRKISTSVAAGNPPDILQVDGPVTKNYAFNNLLLPLGDYYTADELKAFPPASIEEGSFQGKLYAPPLLQSCSLMVYNTEMASAAGVTFPTEFKDSLTMEQSLERWQKLTRDTDGDGTPDVFGVMWGQTLHTDYETGLFRRSAGAKGTPAHEGIGPDGVTFTGYFDHPDAIRGMEFYQKLHTEAKVAPQAQIPEIFENKKAATWITPDNVVAKLLRVQPDGNFPWSVTPIPYFEGGTQLCHTGSWHYGVSSKTANVEAAVAFVKFATTKDGVKRYYDANRQLPAHLELLNELPEYQTLPQKMFKDAMLTIGVPRIQTPAYNEYQEIALETFRNVAAGGNVADLMKSGAQRMNQAAAKYKR